MTCQLSVNIFRSFFTETTGPIAFKFNMQPLGKGGKKVYIFHSGHMTKMAATPIYVKNLNNPVQNHLADRLET